MDFQISSRHTSPIVEPWNLTTSLITGLSMVSLQIFAITFPPRYLNHGSAQLQNHGGIMTLNGFTPKEMISALGWGPFAIERPLTLLSSLSLTRARCSQTKLGSTHSAVASIGLLPQHCCPLREGSFKGRAESIGFAHQVPVACKPVFLPCIWSLQTGETTSWLDIPVASCFFSRIMQSRAAEGRFVALASVCSPPSV